MKDLILYKPGATVVLTDGRKRWPVQVSQIAIRAKGYVAYEVSWLTDGSDRRSLWVEASELGHCDEPDTLTVGWFHPLLETAP